jgi:phenylacetic acid degradation operon negative regulatory protein
MPTDPLLDTIAELHRLGGQRVWSLLVTVFGDLAQEPGQVIEGRTLSAIMTAMSIRPEATRVALHRLRNDGWIESQKVGRTSHHALTDLGRSQSAAAAPRIYGTSAQSAEWQVCILPPAANGSETSRMAALGYAELAPRVFVGPAGSGPEDGLYLTVSEVPIWVQDALISEEIAQDYVNLRTALQRIETQVPAEQSALDRAVLRTLIVHNWRRIVLKHPELPAQLLPRNWQGHACRELVHKLLDRHPRPKLGDIAPGS